MAYQGQGSGDARSIEQSVLRTNNQLKSRV